MKHTEKAKHIIEIIRSFTEVSTTAYIRAVGELAKVKTEAEMIEREEKRNGEFGFRVPSIDIEEKTVAQTLKEKQAREEILVYAIDVFLEQIST